MICYSSTLTHNTALVRSREWCASFTVFSDEKASYSFVWTVMICKLYVSVSAIDVENKRLRSLLPRVSIKLVWYAYELCSRLLCMPSPGSQPESHARFCIHGTWQWSIVVHLIRLIDSMNNFTTVTSWFWLNLLSASLTKEIFVIKFMNTIVNQFL